MPAEILKYITIINSIITLSMLGAIIKIFTANKNSIRDEHSARVAQKDIELEKIKSKNELLEERLKLRDEEVAQEQFIGEHRGNPTSGNDHYRIISRNKISEFYNLIAGHYNRRNMGPYGATYDKIASILLRNLNSTKKLKICDLGGGTGWLLQKLQHYKPYWVNIDISQKMIDVFNSDYDWYPKREARNSCVSGDSFIKNGEHFNAVIANYLISSMDGGINFERIRPAMHTNSIFVIADNHFSYVHKFPRYGFDNINNENIAIEPSAVHREYLLNLMDKNGFCLVDEDYVVLDGLNLYSQIFAFKLKN